MVDLYQKLFIWEIILLSFIVLLPIIRKILRWNKTTIDKSVIKPMILITFVSAIIQYSYYKDYLNSTEFQFIQLISVLIYFNSGYNATLFEWEGIPIEIKEFNLPTIAKISKALNGTDAETIKNGIKFSITTPYRLQFDVEGIIDQRRKRGKFFIFSTVTNFRILKVIQFLGLYLIIMGLDKETETVSFPLFDFDISSIFAVMATISLSILIIMIEIQSGNTFASDLPVYYKKILHQSALDSLYDKKIGDIDVKDKAQALLDKRKSNVIAAKKSELRNKLDKVYGEKDNEGIDPETIKRVRLMETVKRILNSTPPWTTVTLKEIIELAKGSEEEVEMVIAGLRELKEVSGIYDIWTKTYIGTSISHWFITKVLTDIDDKKTKVENLKIFPDGGAEFSLKNKEVE